MCLNGLYGENFLPIRLKPKGNGVLVVNTRADMALSPAAQTRNPQPITNSSVSSAFSKPWISFQ
ncbi:hypothetical protein SAMN04488023_14019 [Pedobacter rhizosphaerae]|uniref:Uncharacterized protein n=1 Tax=Pedobacter rhizosphaerae TaxID=390241 RepID=A0A1H9VAG0_9SPHI|nr:hypothetical protein SAMN04488023_14019 [Pedobacter rhizosphaerae]